MPIYNRHEHARRAVGSRDVLLQFNTEAVIVGLFRGVLGLIFGLLTGWVISLFGVGVVFSFTPAIVAFACAVATGLVFGYLPARTAARLDPIAALSAE
jgi:macrolide transport system ATP-binding/permease protein